VSTAELSLGSPGGVSQRVLDNLKADLAVTLQGLPYLFARSGYGNELTLHFGTERDYAHPKLTGKIRGTHILSVRGSAWLLRSGIQPVMIACGIAPKDPSLCGAKPFNVTVLESGALIGQGAKVVRATPLAVGFLNAIGLDLELDDGSGFTIFPTAPDDDSADLPNPADWELLTPDRVFRVGPEPNYSVEDFGAR